MRAILIIAVVLVAAGAGLDAQDPLGTARDLYASAAYEDALSALNKVAIGSAAPEVARQADQYRVFCLYALGRTTEAESIAESMIRKAPLLPLDVADVSPRIESMFAGVRRRLLPSLTRERFRTARVALDQKRFKDAEPLLTEARLMIEDAQSLGVKDEGLVDLSVLVDGFLQLIRTADEQQAQAPSRPALGSTTAPTTGAPRPAASSPSTAETAPPVAPAQSPPPTVVAAPAPGPNAGPAAVVGPRVYSVADHDVTLPVVLDQRLPLLPSEMTQMAKAMHGTAIVEVVIDEGGLVVDATIRQSLNVGFDNAILRAARRWKYRPATKNGVAVRFVKTIAVVP